MYIDRCFCQNLHIGNSVEHQNLNGILTKIVFCLIYYLCFAVAKGFPKGFNNTLKESKTLGFLHVQLSSILQPLGETVS